MNRFFHTARVPLSALAGSVALLAAPSAWAASAPDDIAAIRSELMKLQQDYESKIKDLQDRLGKAESEAAAAKEAAASAQSAAQAAAQDAQKTAAAAQMPAPPAAPPPIEMPRAPAQPNAFNPVIAAVLNGFYTAATRDPASAKIPGFALGDEALGPSRGFSLGESEVALSANIDPFLFGSLNLSMPDNHTLNVEEAYIQTTGLGSGVTLKAGEFLSAIGYLNERHAHDWSFSDAPLPYRAFLNGQYGDAGVQARWLAPTDIYLELGAEWMRGDAFPAGNGANNGKGTVTAFVHAGDDINDASSWLAALSFLHSRADGRMTGADRFSGTDNLGIASLVYKWAPGGNPTVQNLIVSGEFFFGRESGYFNSIPMATDSSGWYLQSVYQFMPRWSFGLRYAELGPGSVGPALAGSTLDSFGHTPRAETALLEFDTSEFGRFRVQYTHDTSDLKPLDQLIFQYTVIYGPHGAHRY